MTKTSKHVTLKSRQYDVIIVGGGPAGIFTALELSKKNSYSILVVEKGKDIKDRVCPVQDKGVNCLSCFPCNLVSGLGGAGAYSDGKLTLSTEVGGRLEEIIGKEPAEQLIDYIVQLYIEFGGSDGLYGIGDEVENLKRKAMLAELRLIPVKIRHMGNPALSR